MKLIHSNVHKAALGWITPTFWGTKLKHIELAVVRVMPDEILNATILEEEDYRNGGTAAAGAIIGGVLTGGIGILLGAAYGGRKKGSKIVRLDFTDDRFVVLEFSKKEWNQKSQYLTEYLYN